MFKSSLKTLHTNITFTHFIFCKTHQSHARNQKPLPESRSERVNTKMYFCNQRKHFAEPSILLEKTPIKVVSEAKFLGVVFDRTLSYSSHVNYLKTNRLKALYILKVVGHTDWGQTRKVYSVFIGPL